MSSSPLACLTRGLDFETLPELTAKSLDVPHAPVRVPNLSKADFMLAVKNALRYFPAKWHSILAPEFAQELKQEGHIYMRRFKPVEYKMKAYPLPQYPCRCTQAAVIMLMIMNNLDPAVAQFPEELITYGGNGSVFSNWAQYCLTMQYLSQMTDSQTLKMASGHPAGLFPSRIEAPRVVITNGMVIPNYSTKADYDRLYALGVTQYGQMTAGSYCYIGPQGIVHGTTITILNAGRKYLGKGLTTTTTTTATTTTAEQKQEEEAEEKNALAGVVYLSSGLGGMSGAQGKAGVICGAVTVIAEVDETALDKRHAQGWITEKVTDAEECVERIIAAKQAKKAVAIGFLGNIVTLLEVLSARDDHLIELCSDQTSLHNPFNGGYYPVQLSFSEANVLMKTDPVEFKRLVQVSLCRHVTAINALVSRGTRFWDYGNSFLLQASKAGADIMQLEEVDGDVVVAKAEQKFKYPSYVQEFMGDIFSLGFGPFRWVCTSGNPEDLKITDQLAAEVIKRLSLTAPAIVNAQWRDNLLWIEQADDNNLVVGSQARILYADAEGRQQIALAFNEAVKTGKLSAPVLLSRDHHDVSGTDSPFRETSNIYDGSQFCADMSVHNVIGDAFRGATYVAIHNGGGVGWGYVMNGGFGLVLDGTTQAANRASLMLLWDVNNGVSRRAWSGNENANFAIKRSMEQNPLLTVTLATVANSDLLASVCD